MRRSRRLAVAACVALAAASVGVGSAVERAAAKRARAFDPDEALRAGAGALRAAAAAAGADEGVAAVGVAPVAGDVPEADRRCVRSGASALRVELDRPQGALGTAVSVAGRDPGAPRPLELWRIGARRTARVASGWSVAGGALAFPAMVLPAGDVTLVAAPLGSGPDGPGASAPVAVRRDPSAPRVEARLDADRHEIALHVAPTEPDGAIVVLSGAAERARIPVAADADGHAAAVDAALALGADDREIAVAQEIPDGRRSAPRTVAVPETPTVEKTDADPITVAP